LKHDIENAPAGRLELEAVIERCRAIEEKGLNPFTLDIDSIIHVIQEYFPSWENPEELSLDAETVNRLASVIRLQSEWLQRRSSSLYMDPMLVERRLKELSRDQLASVFVASWRPVIEMETLTSESLRDAMDYWTSIPSISERWPELVGDGSVNSAIGRDEFMRSSLRDEETFESRLKSLLDELSRATKRDRILYWDFISNESFEETVERSYLASFLVSYGWANLQVDPIQGDIFIQALKRKPSSRNEKNLPTSIVLTISKEDWERRRSSK
jgi:Nse4-like protein